MLKIVIDPGHGGKDPGATHGNQYEKTLNLVIATETARHINNQYLAAVYLTRIADTTMGLTERSDYANDIKADYFVSLHINAGGGTGFESYVYDQAGTATRKYQDILHNRVAGFYKAHGFADRGKKAANFAVLRETQMPAILLENLFIDQPTDLTFLKKPAFLKQLGEAIGEGIGQALQLKAKDPNSGIIPARMPAAAIPDRARQLLKARNPAAPDYIDIYIKMGEIYRIRWDAVFAQSCKETAYWKFGGDVLPKQNNFAGLGTFGGQAGASFATPEDGIEAQFQHWHAYFYGGKLPPGRPPLDPRREAVLSSGRGGALHYVEDLGGNWAPASDYGVSIVRDYMAKFMDDITPGPTPTPTPPPTPVPSPEPPGDQEWNPGAEIERLRQDGLIANDHDPKAPVTWGEFATVLNRLRDRLTSGDSKDNNTPPPLKPPGNTSPGNEQDNNQPTGAELLQNGDFSQGNQGWQGSNSNFQVENNGNKFGANGYNWKFKQDFAVSPGWTLVFSGRTRNGGNPNPARVVISIGNDAGTYKVIANIKHTHRGNGWETLPAQELTVPANAVSGRIYLLVNGGTGVHHFDDLSIKKK